MAGNSNSGRRPTKLGFDAIVMEMKAAEEIRGMRVLARKLLDLAASGDMQAIKEVFNRIDGMPVQQIDQNLDVRTYVAELPPVHGTTGEWLKAAIRPKQNIQ